MDMVVMETMMEVTVVGEVAEEKVLYLITPNWFLMASQLSHLVSSTLRCIYCFYNSFLYDPC